MDILKNFIEDLNSKTFKHSLSSVSDSFFDMNNIYVNLYLVGNRLDQPYKIMLNDVLSVFYVISDNGNDTYTLKFENCTIKVKPRPGDEMLAFSREIIRTRKVTGDIEKIKKSLTTHYDRIYQTLQRVSHELPLEDNIKEKYL